jgi:hypothetical protein
MPDKPRHRSGYSSEETQLVRAACLTVAVTLGAVLEDLCIVGGFVPALLIDIGGETADTEHEEHPGTNDLDLGLSLALLDDERYAEISDRLRREGFEPDTNDAGNPTVQRWRWCVDQLNVTVDFLMPPAPDQAVDLRVQKLQPDFGALVTPGLQLAFDERVEIEIEGQTLQGERATRTVPVCGPAAFTVLKSLAFGDRGEPKDAYDLVYVIRGTQGQGRAIAQRLAEHAVHNSAIVDQALELLARDFDSPAHVGPLRAAEFEYIDENDRTNAAADAHGYVDDLLQAYRSGQSDKQ